VMSLAILPPQNEERTIASLAASWRVDADAMVEIIVR
jgi:hypothetical protein